MTRFLFWNLTGLPRAEQVARLARERGADLIVLAESPIADADLLRTLRRETGQTFSKPWSASSDWLRIYTRYEERALTAAYDEPNGRLTIRRLIVGRRDVLLAAIHFQSKMYWSDADQHDEIQNIARRIRRVEDAYGHRRTVLVGDLNMNPFERGVCSSHGLHGVMAKAIASEESRTVDGREHPYFYNPMWGFFGDRTPGPPGTFCFRKAWPLMYFWNILDQVLVRPALLDAFHDEVTIVDSIDGDSLADQQGQPSADRGSDHFPLHFILRLEP